MCLVNLTMEKFYEALGASLCSGGAQMCGLLPLRSVMSGCSYFEYVVV